MEGGAIVPSHHCIVARAEPTVTRAHAHTLAQGSRE